MGVEEKLHRVLHSSVSVVLKRLLIIIVPVFGGLRKLAEIRLLVVDRAGVAA